MAEPSGCHSNYWLQTLILDDDLKSERDNLLKITNDSGFMTRPVWTLMHRLQQFQGCPRMPLDVSENLSQRLVNIPSSPNLIIEAL
jgi:perosamine synthetase